MRRKIITMVKLLILSAAFLTMAGCLSKATDELYLLPQPSEEYLLLQEKINEIINAGAEYSAPIAGNNRQSVQLEDLDGNGVKEAIAFFNVSGDEKPLKIYVFRNTGDGYEKATVIEGYGTAIESIYYVDINGDSALEIVVGWQMNTGLQMLEVFSMKDLEAALLLSTDYSEYAVFNINEEGGSELLAIRHDGDTDTGVLEMFAFHSEGEYESEIAPLSKGMESISRIKTGYLTNGVPALIIEGAYGGVNVITDIFACRRGSLANITLDMETGVSESTVRSALKEAAVYTRDINSDGVWEVPITRSVPSSDGNSRYLLDWYAYSVSGNRTFVTTTYHNYSDSWYLVLPDSWGDIIAVGRRDAISGERALVFSLYEEDGEKMTDVLVIYYLTGDNKEVRAKLDGRFTLQEESEAIYAAEILVSSEEWELAMTEEEVKSNFNILYNEWVTGVT